MRAGLLYAGTERGVYVSLRRRRRRWQPLPAQPAACVPITDLVVKDDDLVVATQGRSFWILDDLTPLRQLEPDARRARPSISSRRRRRTASAARAGPRAAASNPPYGAAIHYWLKEEPKDEEEVTLEILRRARERRPQGLAARTTTEEDDAAAGRRRRRPPAPPARASVPAKAGLNRFAWDLRHADATRFKGLILWARRDARAARRAGRVPGAADRGRQDAHGSRSRCARIRALASDAGPRQQQALLLQIRDKLHRDARRDRAHPRGARPGRRDAADRAKRQGRDEKVEPAAATRSARS